MKSKCVLRLKYRKIFIVDSYSNWEQYADFYDLITDLVLTYDVGLYKYIQEKDGDVEFIDHLVDPEVMNINNYIVYDFFKKWNVNAEGQDLFAFKSIPFGFSFRLEIWNDLIYTSKLFLCLLSLKEVQYEELFLSTADERLRFVLDKLGYSYNRSNKIPLTGDGYFFPIAKYMDDRIRPRGVRGFLYKVRETITSIYGRITPYVDKFSGRKNKKTIFIQEYHPTKGIITKLREMADFNVLLVNFSRGSKIIENLSERVVPIYGRYSKYKEISKKIIDGYKAERKARLVLSSGIDITEDLYEIIDERVQSAINAKLRILDCSIDYVDRNKVDLEILIANIGPVPTLFDCVCRERGIPSYLIINGILGPDFSDDSKYATIINSYSSSIKENYFKGMDNIVTLGDPRMDMYPPLANKREINRSRPTVVIGASGFSPVDLNSYVAIEFDFMFDVLSGMKKIKENGIEITVVIKVRPNGYKSQYQKFSDEFFPGLVDDIIDLKPMKEVLNQCDLYISINSQTLFEASCLGIPVLYYKKDTEVMVPPFDNKSELVTVTNVDALVKAFADFQSNHKRYEIFLDREVMEKYIGPLDGNNLKRNLEFVYELLDKKGSNNDCLG